MIFSILIYDIEHNRPQFSENYVALLSTREALIYLSILQKENIISHGQFIKKLHSI